MQINTDRERYLDLLRSGEPWTRRKEAERRLLTSTDIDALRQELDAGDVQPVDKAKVFYSGVFAGVIYGAFFVLVWKWFR